MKKLIFRALVLSIMMACSGEKKEKKEAFEIKSKPKTEAKAEKKEEAITPADATVVELGSNDQMKFDKSEIKVPAGKKVSLTLTHTGKLDIKVMGHNFVLLKQGTDIAKFAGTAMSNPPLYLPSDKSEVIAYTKTIGGGDSVTITFDAPEKGTYDFICSFPGHYAIMKGKFIVE